MTVSVSGNDSICIGWEWQYLYLGMTVSVSGNDSICIWEWQYLYRLGMTVSVSDGNDSICIWEWQYLYLGMTVSVSDGNDSICIWEWQYLYQLGMTVSVSARIDSICIWEWQYLYLMGMTVSVSGNDSICISWEWQYLYRLGLTVKGAHCYISRTLLLWFYVKGCLFYMNLSLHVKVIKALILEYLHKFPNCILLILLCRLLTYSKLPPVSHHTFACSYWAQPACSLLWLSGRNSWGRGSDRWVCLGDGKETHKKHPHQTTPPSIHTPIKPHPHQTTPPSQLTYDFCHGRQYFFRRKPENKAESADAVPT
jgi:hypothetical protein